MSDIEKTHGTPRLNSPRSRIHLPPVRSSNQFRRMLTMPSSRFPKFNQDTTPHKKNTPCTPTHPQQSNISGNPNFEQAAAQTSPRMEGPVRINSRRRTLVKLSRHQQPEQTAAVSPANCKPVDDLLLDDSLASLLGEIEL